MMGRAHVIRAALAVAGLLIAGGAASSGAAAERPRSRAPELKVSLRPVPAPEGGPDAGFTAIASGPGAPYKALLELELVGAGDVEVVADRRLLELTVRDPKSRRRYRCRHPDAPRRSSDAHVVTLGAHGGDRVYREWIDLRMYCFGRLLRRLTDGVVIEPSYGFRGRGRQRWIARGPHSDAELRRVEVEPYTLALPAEAPPGDAPSSPAPVEVSMSPVDVRNVERATFRVQVRAAEGRERIYLRPDLVRFRVHGPTGAFECAISRQIIEPIVDFFSTVTERRAASERLLALAYCSEGFPSPGIYDVVPIVDLIYDGKEQELGAVTGTFEGEAVPVRIRESTGPYVQHALVEPVAPGHDPVTP